MFNKLEITEILFIFHFDAVGLLQRRVTAAAAAASEFVIREIVIAYSFFKYFKLFFSFLAILL